MTTVANQPVGPDSISGSVGKGSKSNVGNRECFLGAARKPSDFVGGVHAGTMGGALGPGHGALPKATAGTLTSIEKPLKDKL